MRLLCCTSTTLRLTAYGVRRLSEYRSALLLLFILSLLLPVTASARGERYISTADTIGVKVYFKQGYSTLQPDFRDNSVRLDEFIRRVSEMHTDTTVRLNSVDIVAYASPEGSYTLNKRLARKRADNISAYLRDRMSSLDGALFSIRPQGIDWSGLAAMVEASDMRYRSEVLHILRDVPETTYRGGRLVDSRLKQLMDLRGGRPYNYMSEHFFPELRAAGAYVICDFVRVVPTAVPDTIPAVSVEADESASIRETDAVGRPLADTIQSLGSMPQSSFRGYDRWAIKTDALYLAAGVTNIGVEYAFHPHWSLDLPLVYSPYTLARTYRLRFLYIQPEARYWLDRPMTGHCFGVHIHAGVFNVSFDKKNRYQSENGFYGAGISYGYAMPLSRRWSMEFTVGLGYVFTRYSTYINEKDGVRYERDVPYNYWGVTKLGVNFVYRFGDKCGRTHMRKEGRL